MAFYENDGKSKDFAAKKVGRVKLYFSFCVAKPAKTPHFKGGKRVNFNAIY